MICCGTHINVRGCVKVNRQDAEKAKLAKIYFLLALSAKLGELGSKIWK